MKKYFFKSIITAISFLMIFNCAGNNKGSDLSPEASRKVLKNTPNWFMKTPTKEGFRYASATATSQDLQLAINKARLDAAQILAGEVTSEMNGLSKRAQEETGLGPESHIIDQFSQTQEQVITTSLQDWKVSKKNIYREKNSKGNNIFRAYVLIEWDEGAAQKRLLDKIKSEKEIYEAIRATELYEEMEDKVEKYRERYGY